MPPRRSAGPSSRSASRRIPSISRILASGSKPEIGGVGDPGELALAALEELLLDVGLPAERLEDADGALGVEHPLGERGEDLLVRAPGGRAARRGHRGRDVGDGGVSQAQGFEGSHVPLAGVVGGCRWGLDVGGASLGGALGRARIFEGRGGSAALGVALLRGALRPRVAGAVATAVGGWWRRVGATGCGGGACVASRCFGDDLVHVALSGLAGVDLLSHGARVLQRLAAAINGDPRRRGLARWREPGRSPLQ